MKVHVSPSVLAAIGIAYATAASSAEPFQVLRAGDREMACEALAAEVNTLTEAASKRQKAAEAKARRAEGGRKLLGFAAAMSSALPALSYNANSPVAGYAAQAAMSAVQQGQMAAQMGQLTGSGDIPPETGEAPEQARIDHLTGIFNAKAC